MAARSVAVFSPAKINLFLAVTGKRADGFHNLVSLAAPLTFGDTVQVRVEERPGPVICTCNDPAIPTDTANLAVRAAEAHCRAAGREHAITIDLQKRIPVGAGLGGGSSNAVAVLRALDQLAARPIGPAGLNAIAASLGSDCSLFLADGPCVIRGRGEIVTPVPAAVQERLRGRRVLLFKPNFSIDTKWAYERLQPQSLVSANEAEARLSRWLESDDGPAALLFNSFESVVSYKFVAIAELLALARAQPEWEGALLSGSGSASFALPGPNARPPGPTHELPSALGPEAWLVESTLA